MSDPPTKIKYKYCVIMNKNCHCLGPPMAGVYVENAYKGKNIGTL